VPHPRTLYRGLVAVLGALLVGLLPSTAYAAPSVAEIEKQINAAWEKLEPAIEQYNKVHSELLKNQKKARELQKKIAPLTLEVQVSLGQVADMASAFYMTGRASRLGGLLNAKSPDQFLDQLTTIEQIAQTQQASVAVVAAQKSKYDAQKAQLDQLIATQREQDAALAAQKKTIQAEMDRLQKLRIQAYGTSTVGGSLRIGACPQVLPSGKRAIAVKKACSLIGKPYVWGATGPNSFDCSGLTQEAWAAAGVSLTHYTGAQFNESHYVSRSSLLPGDLVFFYSDRHHVGIYVGNGLMVHAPHSGDYVRMAYISNMPISSSGTRSVL
jgi:cell wall-associated NlpC family hydrolase